MYNFGATPNYGGYPSYQNYGYQQQQRVPQQQQPQMFMNQQPQMPSICYAKMEEAKPFIITSANSSVLFIDRENNKALLKSTDNVCNSFSRYFNIEETDENGNLLKKQEPTPKVDFEQFATKKQLNGFVTIEQYDMLLEQLNAIKKQIMGVKPNVSTATKHSN